MEEKVGRAPLKFTRRQFLEGLVKGVGAVAAAPFLPRADTADAAVVPRANPPVDANVPSEAKSSSKETLDVPPIFDAILTRLNGEFWDETGNWNGDAMDDAPSFAPGVLYAVGRTRNDAEALRRADRTVVYEVGLVDDVIKQLQKDPHDREALKRLVYPAAMGHIALVDGFSNVGGENPDIRTKLEVYSQAGALAAALALILVNPETIDENFPPNFPFSRVQAHAFTADACFQLRKITQNPLWGHLGAYLTDNMIADFWTENTEYGRYFSLNPREQKPPEDWDQGYTFVALAGAYEVTKDQQYLSRGRDTATTALDHLEDKERGGFATAARSPAKFLSGNCAMVRGMERFAGIDPLSAGSLRTAIAGTLTFFENDLYRDGLLYHHWEPRSGRADWFCTGCNFFALSDMWDAASQKPKEYSVFLPMVEKGGTAQNGVAERTAVNPYTEWKGNLETEEMQTKLKKILRNPINLFTSEGLGRCLDSFR